MLIHQCSMQIGKDQRELQPHGTLDFPCAGYRLQCTASGENVIDWHWHEDLELICAGIGDLKVQVPGKTFHLRQGEIAFVNSNVLHFVIGDPRCELWSLAFHAALIEGREGSAMARRYLGPLTACAALDGRRIVPDTPWEREAVQQFLAGFSAIEKGAFGYEFAVRENLSKICLAICRAHREEIETGYSEPGQDAVRIRVMLDFIHTRYGENIGLPEIARSADIGERECLRCFRREIQDSPVQYLLKYRVAQGAALLRREGGLSVSEVALRCGFDSPSNFAQTFKRFFKCTPREYRRQELSA